MTNINDIDFMKVAIEESFKSADNRTKVGACIVKDNQIISTGYNRPPNNFDNYMFEKRKSSKPSFK